MRAYSLASATYEDELEFFSVKVPDGPLTSRLQHLAEGDSVLVGRKPTGTLLLDNLREGRNLFLLGTGTGLAPYLSLVKDPETYERFERVVVVHGCRWRRELAYGDYLSNDLPNDEFVGEYARRQLVYYPTVTREPFRNHGRISLLLTSGKLTDDLGLPAIDRATDRFMLCGSPAMLSDLRDDSGGARPRGGKSRRARRFRDRESVRGEVNRCVAVSDRAGPAKPALGERGHKTQARKSLFTRLASV